MKISILTDALGLRADDEKLVQKFRDQNHEVFIIDWLTVDCQKYESDIVLIRTPWDYSQNPERFIRLIENLSKKSKVIHDLSIIKWNMDKKYLSDFFEKGLSVVPTYVINGFDEKKLKDLDQFLPENIVVKPRIGASGINTFLVDKNEIFNTLDVLNNKNVLVQPFMPEIKNSGELSFIFFGDKFSHAVVKTAKQGEFRIQEDHGGSVKRFNPSESEILEVQELLTSIQLKTVYARVDVVRHESKFLLMELEVIEPELFFRFSDNGEELFYKSITQH